MTTDETYMAEVGQPLQQLLLDALHNGEWTFQKETIKTLTYRGWYDFKKATLVERDTTKAFENYLRSKINNLLDLALLEPPVFDQELGVIRANYKIVAKKMTTVLIEGGRFTTEWGLPYDGPNKIHNLEDIIWICFYKTLKARLEKMPRSLGKTWALIIIELRCRAHDDERKRRHYWRDSTPFGTDFNQAYLTYPLNKVQEFMVTDNPEWFT